MKKYLHLVLAAAVFSLALSARAWSYIDTHALLIFRASGHNDVEFDLGDIGQFLNKAGGYTAPVTGWTLAPVTNEFGADLTGVSIVLLAVTPKDSVNLANDTAWVSSADNVTTVADFTSSAWQSKLWSTINSVGSKPSVYLTATSNTWYSIPTSSAAAYDTIVVAGGPINQLGGNVSFAVEEVIPGTLKLWAIQPSTTNPKPAAAQVGSFTITAAGALTFHAGSVQAPTPSTITGITRSGGISYVTFTTISGGTYQLRYASTLGSAVTNWPAVGGMVGGDGVSHTLTHTNTTASGFYSVLRSP